MKQITHIGWLIAFILNPLPSDLSAQHLTRSKQAHLRQTETDPKIGWLIAQLDAKHPVDVRTHAAKELGRLDKNPKSLAAVDALKAGLKDPNDEVRYQSLANLTFILAEHNQPCPPEMFELANDSSIKIKTNFPYLLDFYDTFPPELLPTCLSYYENLDDDQKPSALVLLGKAGGKNKVVMKTLFDAVNSSHAQMRINGTAGLWAATHDLEILLPLYFDRLADFDEIANLPEDDNGRFEGANSKGLIRLAHLGIGVVFSDHLSRRPREFEAALSVFASSSDPQTRQKLANYLAVSIGQAAAQIGLEKDERLIAFADCDYSSLQKLVSKLAHDTDESVAKQARETLKHIAALNQK